jgi:hypothetical protein
VCSSCIRAGQVTKAAKRPAGEKTPRTADTPRSKRRVRGQRLQFAFPTNWRLSRSNTTWSSRARVLHLSRTGCVDARSVSTDSR